MLVDTYKTPEILKSWDYGQQELGARWMRRRFRKQIGNHYNLRRFEKREAHRRQVVSRLCEDNMPATAKTVTARAVIRAGTRLRRCLVVLRRILNEIACPTRCGAEQKRQRSKAEQASAKAGQSQQTHLLLQVS
jgi:hypothetical protein